MHFFERNVTRVVSWTFSIMCMVFLLFSVAQARNVSEPIVLQLAWKHQFQFAGYYAALHKGFYNEVGLDVSIVEGGEGQFAREEVKSGHAQYGVAGSELILHRAEGDPFVVIAAILQHSPSVLLTRRDSNISTLHDLIGKKVMLLPENKDADILAAFINEGIPLSTLERMDQTYNLSDLIDGRTDAVSAYETNEPWLLRQKGIEPALLLPRAYGVDFYSDCLFTTENEVAHHPQRVQLFLQASLKGWQYAIDNPEEIVEILRRQYHVSKDPDHLRFEAASIVKNMRPEYVKIGHINSGRWKHILKTYADQGMIDPNFSLEGFIYEAESSTDLTQMWWAVKIGAFIIVVVGAGAIFLLFFNKKLAAEIAERREVEKSLKESELRYKQAQQVTKVGHWGYDLANEEFWGSDQAKQMYGLDPISSKFTPEDIEGCIPERTRVHQALVDLIEKNIPYDIEFEIRPVAGPTSRIIRSIAEVERESDGTSVKVVGVIQDITEYKRNQEELQKKNDNIIERVKELNCLYSISTFFENHTSTFEETIIKITNIIPPSWKYPEIACSKIEINGEEYCTDNFKETDWVQHTDINVYNTKVGAVFVYYTKEMPEMDEGPFMKEERCLLNEIGEQLSRFIERRKMAEEKIKLESQLHQSQKIESIGTLAGGIAHDFNNILSAIIGFTELALEDAIKGSEQEENLSEVFAAGSRAKELVKQILAFARQAGEEMKPVRIGNLIEEVLKLVRPSTPTTIEVISNLNSNSLVMGNESQLHQVALNLCTNAIQSMQQKGGVLKIDLRDITIDNTPRVPLNLLAPGQYVELAVMDNGPGIEPAIIENIFEPYFTTKGIGEGSGMGLAVTRGIIESCGGDIQVVSTPGRETIFKILFPITTASTPYKCVDERTMYKGGSEHLLLVDDEPSIAKMGCRLLESLGYKVTSRTSSSEALELFKAKSQQFDLVLTDMTMPFLTGDELAVEMRKIKPDIPIIICTGYSSKMSEIEAKSLGVNAFAYKPVTKADLAQTVRTVLDSAKV